MMIFRFSCPHEVRLISNSAAEKNRTRPNFIVILGKKLRSFTGREFLGHQLSVLPHCLPDKRPIRRSKNLAESTSTATFALGTNLSRTTEDVRVLARVGADPRMDMFTSEASFSVPGRRRKSPVFGLYPSVSPAVSSPVVSTST